MKKAAAICIIVLLVMTIGYLYLNQKKERGIDSTVLRVIDGDTIEMANGDVVRLIGIDAPEKDHPYSKFVIEKLKSLEGKSVRLEKDVTNKDRYGRYLRYVFLDNHLVNLELVRSGMAYAYVVNPDNRYSEDIFMAEREARKMGYGIWEKSEYSECVNLLNLHYNAEGEDDKNLTGEYFSISNNCEHEILAEDWVVRNGFNAYKIPKFSLTTGSQIRIVTGNGNNSNESVFLSLGKPIWSNKRGELYLIDGSGKIILEKSYKNG
jgi:micrococcal nuclease